MINLGGTYRAVTAEQTLAKIEPLLWDKFGISRVANITGLDHINVPTYIAIRPHAKLLTTAQGKGLNNELAKISAMMESIEGWHCENMASPALFGSYIQLSQDYPLVKLNPSINHGPFEWVDIDALEMPWGKGKELHTGNDIYFPYTSMNVNTASYKSGYRYFPPTTNGLASGNTQEEAICHALFEVLEREFEAQKIVFIAEPKVDLTTIREPHLLFLLEKLKSSNLRLDVWDITNQMQIPTYFAVIHDPDDLRTVGMIMGSGAHFSSVVALSRAITEAIQGRLTIISGSRDDQTPRIYKKIKKVNPQLLQAFEKAEKNAVPFVETDVPADFISCQNELLKRLKQFGFNQVVLYDHTRENLDIPVVQVMVPGLRYIHGSCFSCSVSML